MNAFDTFSKHLDGGYEVVFTDDGQGNEDIECNDDVDDHSAISELIESEEVGLKEGARVFTTSHILHRVHWNNNKEITLHASWALIQYKDIVLPV